MLNYVFMSVVVFLHTSNHRVVPVVAGKFNGTYYLLLLKLLSYLLKTTINHLQSKNDSEHNSINR